MDRRRDRRFCRPFPALRPHAPASRAAAVMTGTLGTEGTAPGDLALAAASAQLASTARGAAVVKGFFDPATSTISYVVHDPLTMRGAVIDSVLDYDAASGRTSTRSAEAIANHVRSEGISIDWLLEKIGRAHV